MEARPTPIPTERLLAEAGFLQRLARGLVRDVHAADDLVQDTLVAALEDPPRKAGPIRGWLATIAANLARNKRRGQARREQREHDTARTERVAGDEIAQGRIELQRQLFELVLTLPAEQRTVLYLRYYEGRTPSAIAEHLAVPLKTVKSRHTRAIAALRAKLDARSGGDRGAWMEALVPFAALRGAEVISVGVPMTIGGIVVKKLVVAGVAALLLVLAWFVFSRGEPVERVAATDRSAPVELESATTTPDVAKIDAPLATRTPAVAPASGTTGALEVHLRWSDGKPAADVGLVVLCEKDPAPRTESFRAITDAQGVVRFEALFAGKVTLVPDMRERFEGEIEQGTTRTIEHTFTPGIDVRGRVLDPKGVAVGTASIWCKGPDYRTADTIRAAACVSDGGFRLRDVSEDAVIGARAPRFRASNCLRVSDIAIGPSGAREVELRVGESGGRVRGQVLDPEGQPIERAIVVAGPRGGGMTGGMVGTFPEPGTVVTDEKGHFEIVEDLEPGTRPIQATARGYPVWVGELEVVVDSATFVEIRLERPARIEGRVLGFDDLPVAGIRLIASKEERGGWHRDTLPASGAVSDEQGRYVLEWIKPGRCELNASDSSRSEVGRGHAVVNCTAGQTASCDIRLERGNTISGRVEDGKGVALAGWNVYAETAGAWRTWFPRQAKSAADGSFTIYNLGDGEHDLLVRSPDIQIAPRARANRIPIGTKDVVLVVADASTAKGSLRARLSDPSGHSLADLQVTLWKSGENMGSFLTPDSRSGVVESEVQPGRYRIQVARSRNTVCVSKDFVIEEGRLTEVGDLVVGALGRVEVRIKDMPKELARLHLSLEGPGRPTSGNLDASDGVWRSGEIVSGPWFVTTNESEIFLRGVEVEVPPGGTAQVELTFERAFPVRIAIEDPGAGDVTIEARDGAGKLLRFGRIRIDKKNNRAEYRVGLPAGRASIEVRTLEGLSGRVDVDVNASLRTPVTVPLH